MNEDVVDGSDGLDRRALPEVEQNRRVDERASAALLERARAIEAAGVQRRHEELLESAVREDGLDPMFVEQIHEIALEEGLAPAYGLALVATGVGVEELVPPESGDDESIQQTAPEWVTDNETDLAAIQRERRLRSSMRRLRHFLERESSADGAVQSFLAEPDVGHISY